MKRCVKNPSLMHMLLAALGLMLAGRVTAQTFTVLHSFTLEAPYFGTNNEGASPTSLVISGNTLYGTTDSGGATTGIGNSTGSGTVFALNTDGTGFSNIYSFTDGSDGRNPGGLVLSGNTLYGMARAGGTGSYGTVFKVNTDGTGFTTLHGFTGGSDGADPSGLVLSGNTLYGTAGNGGISWNNGTVFALDTDGTGFTNLHSFTGDSYTGGSDGDNPSGRSVLLGNTMYGAASAGGSWGNGTVFAVNTDGTGFTNIYSFSAGKPDSSGNYTNSDGADPMSGLVLAGNTLYGTTYWGGSSGCGTVFKVNTDSTGFTTIYSFNGSRPFPGALILSGSTLYGATDFGGSWGMVFAVNTDGTGFTNIYSFSYYTNSDGGSRITSLLLSGNTLYGTTYLAGVGGSGTIFSISLPVSSPELTITSSAANVLLTWPTNFTGFILQSATNLSSQVWTKVVPDPVVINGQNTVTNPISGTQQFFRLSR